MKWYHLAALGVCISCLLAFVLGAGCVTMAKNLIEPEKPAPEIPIATPTTPAPSPTPNISQPAVYVEDPADLIYRSQGRSLGQPFSWQRDDVGKGYGSIEGSGKDMHVQVSVYDSLFLSRLRWWSDSNGKYYWLFPEPGGKFLFVFARLEMVGETEDKDPRYYVGEPWQRWAVQYNDTVVYPDEYALEYGLPVRIRELEEKFTLNDDARVKPFGYAWEWRQEGGWQAISPYWLRFGKSNAWDGYIVFRVPAGLQKEDLIVLSQWDSFGRPWWSLA